MANLQIMCKPEEEKDFFTLWGIKRSNCLFCNKTMVSRISKKQLFCCHNCKIKYYYYNTPGKKEKVRIATRIWREKNPERHLELSREAQRRLKERNPDYFNKYARENYKNNREIWQSRSSTSRVLRNKNKTCQCEKNGEWHHEIYPTRKKDILLAYNNHQIYPLCKSCHEKFHRDKNG